MNSDDSGELL